MDSSVRALTLHSLIYTAGYVIARLANFLLLPLYTNLFEPAQYGTISLAYAFIGFMGIVLHFGLDAALLKHYVPANLKKRKSYVTNTVLSLLFTSGVFFLLVWFFKSDLDSVLLGVTSPKYMMLIGGILILDVLWSIPLLLLRAEGKPISFTLFTIFNAISGPLLILYLLLQLDHGLQGVFEGQLLASALTFLLTAPITIRRMAPEFLSIDIWKKLMRFGLPFLPSGIFAMIMQMADQYILKFFTNMESVGIYGAGYKLGMVMLLIVMGFNTSWEPFFLQKDVSGNRPEIFAAVGTAFVALLGFFWVGIVLWIDLGIQIRIGSFTLYGPNFWSGATIAPWVALGYMFHGIYLLQYPGLFRKSKSKWVAITGGTGALSNILLNFIFIPLWGGLGAALATTVSFGLMAWHLYYVNKQLYPIPYDLICWLKIGLIMAGIYVLHRILGQNFAERTILTLLYPLSLWGLGIFGSRERTAIKRLFPFF